MPDTWNWTNYDTKSNFSWSPPHTLKTNGGITYFVRFQLNAAAPPSPPLKIFLAVQQVRPGPSLILGGERGGTKFKITMSFQKVNVLDFEVPLVKAHRKYQVFAKIIKGFGKRVQFHVSTDVGKCAGSFATGLIGAARRGGYAADRVAQLRAFANSVFVSRGVHGSSLCGVRAHRCSRRRFYAHYSCICEHTAPLMKTMLWAGLWYVFWGVMSHVIWLCRLFAAAKSMVSSLIHMQNWPNHCSF